jgi:hypothetical protein
MSSTTSARDAVSSDDESAARPSKKQKTHRRASAAANNAAATATTTATATAAPASGRRNKYTKKQLRRARNKIVRDVAAASSRGADDNDSDSSDSDDDSDEDDDTPCLPRPLRDEIAAKKWSIPTMSTSTFNSVLYTNGRTTLVNCVDGVSIHPPGFSEFSMNGVHDVSFRCRHPSHNTDFGKLKAQHEIRASKFAAFVKKTDARNANRG